MGRYEEYLKKKEAAKKGASDTSNKKPSPSITSTAITQSTQNTEPQAEKPSSIFDDYIARKNAAKEAGPNQQFQFAGNNYFVDSATGQARRGANPYAAKKNYLQSVVDRNKQRDTGHETLFTDLGQSLGGGAESWGASQLSTGATLGLAYNALKNKDNFYQPEEGSNLWKMVNASSANTRAANEKMEDSKKGRGKVGQIAMDVSSQAVMNGIDAALKSLPVVGQALGSVSFASRSFGGTAQQKRDEGKSIGTQVLAGAVSAAIESATESMWTYGGVRSYSGKAIQNTGPLGKLATGLEAKLAEKAGPVVSKLVMSFGSEAVEEMLADVLNPVVSGALEGLTKDSKAFGDYEAEEWQDLSDILYDGLIGGISGLGGGAFESVGAVQSYNENGRDNKLYATAIRNEFEQQQKYGKAQKSLFDAMNAAYNRKTQKDIQQSVMDATGTYVTRKQALAALADDVMMNEVYDEAAKAFSEKSFANEAVDKDVLYNAALNYLRSGKFAEYEGQLNDVQAARQQIDDLSKEIMNSYLDKELENIKNDKSKKRAAKRAMLLSMKARLFNQNNTTEQQQMAEEEEITAPKSYRYTQEELEADQARREAELHPEQEAPAWKMPTFDITREDEAFIQQNNPELWAEYEASATLPTARERITATRDALQKMNAYLTSAKANAQTTQETKAEAAPAERTRTEQEQKLSKADQRKIDQLFNGTKKSLIPSVDAKGTDIVNAIYARAKQEGKKVISKERKDGRYRYTINDGSPLFEQGEKISEIYDKLGLEEKEPETKIRRLASDAETKEINSFRGDNFFLSNFYETPVTIDGITYPTAENAFQAQKCANEEDKKKFVNIKPSEAKRLGKTVKLVDNWNSKRIDVMREVLQAKFSNEELAQKLANTNDAKLVEGNSWGDTFWGVSDGKGANRLGRLLEEIRDGTSAKDSKTANSLNVILKNISDGTLDNLSQSDLQYALNYTLKKANISRRSFDILDDISDYILGNFAKEIESNPFGYGESGYSYSYENRERLLNDEYTTSDEIAEGKPLSENQNTLLNLISEFDRRRLDINRFAQMGEEKAQTESFPTSEESEAKQTANQLADEEENKKLEQVFGAEANEVKQIVNALHEAYDEDFPTEEAERLRSSLLSGFAPSAEVDIGGYTPQQRLAILKIAFPNDEFSFSKADKNIIEDRSYGYVGLESSEERRWNKTHLQNGSQDEVNNPAKNAFGLVPTNDTGWVQPQKISAEEKLSALEKINRARDVVAVNEAKGTKDNSVTLKQTLNAQKKLDEIDKRIKNIQSIFETRRNNLINYAESQKSQLQEYIYDVMDELEDLGNYGYMSAEANLSDNDSLKNETEPTTHLQKLVYQRNMLGETIKYLKNTKDASKIYDDRFNRKLIRQLEEAKKEYRAASRELTRQQGLVEEANRATTKQAAFKQTWLDRLSPNELLNLLDRNTARFTEAESKYVDMLLDKYFPEQQKIESLAGPDTGYESYNLSRNPASIVEGENENERREGYISSSSGGTELQDREGIRRGAQERSGIRSADSVDSFGLGNDERGRIAYNSKGDYISVYNDGKNGETVGRVLNDNETTGEEFDKARATYASRKNVEKVIFVDGQVYDSGSNTLNDALVVTFPDGRSAVICATNDLAKNVVHEDTHLAVAQNKANGNSLFTNNSIRNTLDTILGDRTEQARAIYATTKDGKYDRGDFAAIYEEILCNINAEKECYGYNWAKHKDALKKSDLYKYLTTETTGESEAGIRRFASEEQMPTLDEFRKSKGDNKRENLYEMREERAISDAEQERLNLDDAEYWERRRADKDMPSLAEYYGEETKIPAPPSPAEANELVERSFGRAGHKRATKVVEAFQRIKSPFADLKGELGAKGEAIRANMSDMLERLIDVNDGYGTIKNVVDTYKKWNAPKATMADYYDQNVADMFDKILSDAEESGWNFKPQDQREFAQAYEEACNAMMAKIKNVNNDSERLTKLATEALTNKLNIKSDGLISKALQRFVRYQLTTDTAMKLFGGFKGSGEFYKLGQDIKDSVTKRMTKYIEAQSYFDSVKKMDGFKEFADDTKTYKLDPNSEFLKERNPLADKEFTLQQIVTIDRLFKTLRKTFEHSDKGYLSDRIKGFVIRDSKGNSYTVDLGETELDRANQLTAISNACDKILDSGTPAAEAAKAYSKACDEMFKMLGKDVSSVKKALTGNALSLIGEDYTPVLWANEDGTPADFNFNDDNSIRPPKFLYNRTGKQGHLVVSPISYIVDKYIENASDYIGTAQIKDTLKRLNTGNSIVNNGKGLNSTLAENFGKDAGTWFDEYVKDLTEYGENDSIWAALRRNMQKGALIGSPSVMMKQTSSYWSAMGLLSPEALVTAYRWKVGAKAADSSEYNNLLKYRRTTNNIDPTLTEIIKGNNKYGKASNSRVFQLFTNGIAEQDFKTVDNLYTATVVDTYLKNQNRDASYFASEQFQNDIDSKFAEVMLRSQPMFDTELRAEYARTDNELVKMTSMFRTQQTQNLNLIATALGEWKAAGADTKGEKAQVLRQTLAGQASAALSLSLLSVAADVMLHGLKKYRGDGDDDDDKAGDGKIELQRVLERIGLNAVETGAGTVWFGDQIAKWLIDQVSGGETSEFYGLNMGPITTMKNVLDNLEYAAKSPTPSNIKNVAFNVAQLMGKPINNIYRYINSAIMYTADLTGQNENNYDDVLKMINGNAKVADKNNAGRNFLVEAGMSKKEANSLIKEIDEDGNGLNKEELSQYYIEHPEDAEKVSILWDSMGWKTSFEKAQKSLDKKVLYNSNPLFAEMDADESESVSKTELTDYALEHPDQEAEIREAYDALGFKGTFASALRSAENSKIKEDAEEAFYNKDYNTLFEAASQMKNGKSWLTTMIKDETGNEYATTTNVLLEYLTDNKLDAKTIDSAIEQFGNKKLVPQYKNLRSQGLSPKQAADRLNTFDANGNGSITQAELADYYKKHKDEEDIIAEFWKACGWSTSWKKYKKSKKLK